MIRLTRVRTESAVPAAFRGVKREAKERMLLEGRRAGNLELDSALWKNAKPQLKKESFGKCAYCEAPTSAVAHGDVEHFRPKSVYWWLACCYDNYLFACQICNQTYKSDNFTAYGTKLKGPSVTASLTDAKLLAKVGTLAPDPVTDDPRCPRAKFETKSLAEKAGLIDPYLLDPEPLLAWEADATLGEVRVKPRTQQLAVKRSVEDCIKFYGLNREELNQWRWDLYEDLADLRDLIQMPGLTAAQRTQLQKFLQRQMESRRPFAGMVRYFVRVEWQLVP